MYLPIVIYRIDSSIDVLIVKPFDTPEQCDEYLLDFYLHFLANKFEFCIALVQE